MGASIRKMIIYRFDKAIESVVRACGLLKETVDMSEGNALSTEINCPFIIGALVELGQAIEKARDEFTKE
jgi:hypothetical protein